MTHPRRLAIRCKRINLNVSSSDRRIHKQGAIDLRQSDRQLRSQLMPRQRSHPRQLPLSHRSRNPLSHPII
nr:hypothetical protein [Geitlerinema sp. P-1104]